MTPPGKMSRAKSGRERQPGERFEFVIEEKGSKATGRMFGVREGRVAAAIVEDRSEKFVVLLIEAVQAHL